MKLRSKLLLPIVISLAIFALFLFKYWEPMLIEQDRSMIISGEHHALASLEATISPALMTADLSAIRTTLDSQLLIHGHHWRSLILIDTAGRRLYTGGNAEANLNAQLQTLEHPIRADGKHIGRLLLTFDLEPEMALTYQHIDELNHSLLLLFIMILAINYLMQEWLFSRPMSKLKQAVSKLEKGDFESELPKYSPNDEIGALSLALDHMRKSLLSTNRQLEDSLQSTKDSEARYKSVVDNIVDGIILIDDKGDILSCNPKAQQIFGYYDDELIGRKVNMLMPPNEDIAHDRYMRNYAETGEAAIIGIGREVKGKHKDGSEFPIDLGINSIEVMGEKQFVGIVRDITERKKSEATLIESREQAEAALKAKSEFLAVMSHELRTPLNGVISMAQLMCDGNLDNEQREQLDVIHDSGLSLLTIIDDILDLTKMESGHLSIKSERFNLEELVEAIQSLLQPRAAEKGLTFSTKITADCPRRLIGDAGRIRQILLNLLGNAIKFTEKGSASLEIKCRAVNETEATLHIAVIDTGIGINSEGQAMLFQLFSQIDSSSTRQYGGTGLGLAISKQLVTQMNGKIGMQDNATKGSTFWVSLTLPLAESNEETTLLA